MRRTNRGMTLTELLVVTAVLTILTSFVSPFLIHAQRAARGKSCLNNMRQIYMGCMLVAKDQFGKLPRCVEPADDPAQEVKRDHWWFRKVSRVMYPKDDPMTVPLYAANPKDPAFRPEQCILRCPESRDFYDSFKGPVPMSPRFSKVHGSGYWPYRVTGDLFGSAIDRVYDDNYGYNNMGFLYVGQREVPNPDNNFNPSAADYVPTSGVPFSRYYKGEVVKGTYSKPRNEDGTVNPNYQPHIGEYSEVPESARTILLMDYIKADAQPFPGLDNVYGLTFRHGARGNVLFVDGHAQIYSKESVLAHMGATKAAPRGRVHWTVYRP